MSKKRMDLRNLILQTVLKNKDNKFDSGGLPFATKDLIYLQSEDDFADSSNFANKVSATDFAVFNNVWVTDDRTLNNQYATRYFTRSATSIGNVLFVRNDGAFSQCHAGGLNLGVRPAMQVDAKALISEISLNKSKDENGQFEIKEVKNINGKSLYQTIEMGEYPKSRADEELNFKLESLFNLGELKNELSATGRWFTVNGQKKYGANWASKQIPEFMFEGERYVRVVSRRNADTFHFADGTDTDLGLLPSFYSIKESAGIRWVKVEPITFKIENWESLPKKLNPNGNGSANFLKLISEDCVVGGVPFYPSEIDENGSMWQNSTIRGFLNGINVTNIKINGNVKYGALNGGNFEGENNFLAQSLNMLREPIYDYVIPEHETEICDHAFAGCVHLNTITLHKNIDKFGNNIFENTGFSNISKTKVGELILSKKPLERDDISVVYDINKLKKAFIGFDAGKICAGMLSNYNFEPLSPNTTSPSYVQKINEIAEKLNLDDNSVPYDFIERLYKNGQIDAFNQIDFKFFRRIEKMIPQDVSYENLSSLYAFAYNIGCLSANEQLSQKANDWLYRRLIVETGRSAKKDGSKKVADLAFDEMHDNFKDWKPCKVIPEFSEFLFSENAQTNSSVFDEIKNELNWNLFMQRIYEEFARPDMDMLPGGLYREKDTGKLMFAVFRDAKNDKGKDISKRKDLKPTVALFKKYFASKSFDGVVDMDDWKIAAQLSRWDGMEQSHFEKAKSIMKEFYEGDVPKNILGKHLESCSTIEVQKYIKETETLLIDGFSEAKNVIEKITEITKKSFTFEWLEKNDPLNFCLGLYCNCCANLAGAGYGIMRSSFVHPDVQNLIVKNKRNIPIAKSTFYINREEGYGVFNNIEVSANVNDDEKVEVYKAYMEGVKAFATEYNKQNPDKSLKKISVGMNKNGLREQIEKGQKPSEILKSINFGEFGLKGQSYQGDWESGSQYLVWYADDLENCVQNEKGGKEL